MTKGNDKTEEGFYDRALDFLRDRLDAPCEAIPTPLLRYLCRETAKAPRITAASGEMPGPELFDFDRYPDLCTVLRYRIVNGEPFVRKRGKRYFNYRDLIETI